jgi:hypothetical protein
LWGCYLNNQSPRKSDILSYKIIGQGNWSIYSSRLGISNPSYKIFSDHHRWVSFWSEEYKRPVPVVDFKKYFVIYITLGQKKTGGYSISLVEILQQTNKSNGNRIKIVLEIEEPGPGQGVDLGETNPYVIAQIESPIFFLKKAKPNQWQVVFVRRLDGQHFNIDMLIIPQKLLNE